MGLSWTTEGYGMRWPWLALGLGVLVLVLLVVWARVWRHRPPRDAMYVAHADRLRRLPRYRTLVRRRTWVGAAASTAALVACIGAILLAGRVQETRTHQQVEATRDILLCLDASGSMSEEDAEVVEEFKAIVSDLEGERIGLTIWNGTAITVFPLTDDYEFVLAQLDVAHEAFDEEDYDYVAGTVLPGEQAASQIGDGLVSCVDRFDRREQERGRAVILASDNDPIGEGVYTFAEAVDHAVEQDVVVHGIAAQDTTERPGDLRAFEAGVRRTGGTFSLLGSDGSTGTIVGEIGELETARIEKPPVVQTLDQPRAGTVVAGVGVALLAIVWLVQGCFWLAGRRGPGGPS